MLQNKTWLKRRKPLKRSPFPMRRSKLRARSVKRAAQERIYSKLRKQFLGKYKFCAVMRYLGVNARAVQIHHLVGRSGERLNDATMWLPVSMEGHNLIHRNVGWARRIGFLLSDSQERQDKVELYANPHPFGKYGRKAVQEAVELIEGLEGTKEE